MTLAAEISSSLSTLASLVFDFALRLRVSVVNDFSSSSQQLIQYLRPLP